MPRIPNPLAPEEIAAPKEPHLTIFMFGEGGRPEFNPLPAGSIFAIVMDPKDHVRGIFPIALVRVTVKRLEFQCPCGQKACTRRAVFNATWSGVHPAGTPQISVRK